MVSYMFKYTYLACITRVSSRMAPGDEFVIHFPCSKPLELQLTHGNTFDVVQKYLMTMLDFQIGKCNVGAEVGWFLSQEATNNKCRLGKILGKFSFFGVIMY